MSTKSWFSFLSRIALLLMLSATTGAAQSAARWKLDDLVAEVLRANPDVQAADLAYQAGLTRPSQMGALPDPKFTFGWMSASTILPGGKIGEDPNANIGFQVSQEFPYPGKRGLSSDAAQKEAESRRFQLSAVARNRVAAVKAAFYDLAYTWDSLDILRENQEALRQLSRVAEARYTVGKAMQQDLIKAETEVAILENRILSFEQRKQSRTAEIYALTSRPADVEPLRPEDVPMPALEPLDTLLAQARQYSPELNARNAAIEGRDLTVSLAKKRSYPDFDIMMGYYYQGKLNDMWEVRAGISIPIFYKSKQRKEVEEAALQLGEAKENYRSTEQMVEYRLRDSYARASTARKLTDLYAKQIVPQSRLAYESSLASYETGDVDFLTVLSNFTTILEYRLRQIEQKAEYLKACTVLEELAGAPQEHEAQS